MFTTHARASPQSTSDRKENDENDADDFPTVKESQFDDNDNEEDSTHQDLTARELLMDVRTQKHKRFSVKA
jgi:hypothetical protein